jgi:hypothetical protein
MDGTALNLLTSFCFLWTLFHSRYRKCYHLEVGCFLCLITSIFYHGSRTLQKLKNIADVRLKQSVEFFRLVDICICQSCVVYFTYQSASYHWLYIGTLTAIVYIFLLYYVLRLSARETSGELWHSTLHIIANIGISCLIEACHETESCTLCCSVV